MKNSKGEEVLLICDNPVCCAIHLAEKYFEKEELKKGEEDEML